MTDNIFVTSDLHFNHQNLLACRPSFNSIEEMNEMIIQNWNKKISRKSLTYLLGDFGFHNKEQLRGIRHRLNGQIILITGNHDRSNKIHKMQGLWTETHEYLVRKFNNRQHVLFHYPIWEWEGYFKGSYHLYGHLHNHNTNHLQVKGSLNVGIDCHNYIPLSIDEADALIENQGNDYIIHQSIWIDGKAYRASQLS